MLHILAFLQHVKSEYISEHALIFCSLCCDWTEEYESSTQLLRTKSDAGVLRGGQRRSSSDQRRIRRHRFSINGHFYNHKAGFTHCKFQLPGCIWINLIAPIFFLSLPFRFPSHPTLPLALPFLPLSPTFTPLALGFSFSDCSFHPCIRVSDQCPYQQLYDHTSGAQSSPQQVQNWEQPRRLRALPRTHQWRWLCETASAQKQSLIPLFHKGSLSSGSEPVPNLEPHLCV